DSTDLPPLENITDVVEQVDTGNEPMGFLLTQEECDYIYRCIDLLQNVTGAVNSFMVEVEGVGWATISWPEQVNNSYMVEPLPSTSGNKTPKRSIARIKNR